MDDIKQKLQAIKESACDWCKYPEHENDIHCEYCHRDRLDDLFKQTYQSDDVVDRQMVISLFKHWLVDNQDPRSFEDVIKDMPSATATETWNGMHGQVTAPKGTFEKIFNDAKEDDYDI